MKVKTTKMIPLLYGNNLHRKLVCEVDSALFAQQPEADLQEALLRTYRTHGYSDADNPEKLYLRKADGEIQPLPLAGMPQERDAIVYQSTIAPSNAYEYTREMVSSTSSIQRSKGTGIIPMSMQSTGMRKYLSISRTSTSWGR